MAMPLSHDRSAPLFRDREAAAANLSVLLWTSLGWLASFVLMASGSAALNVLGTLLCLHTMVLAAYLVHEAVHQTLFAPPGAHAAAGECMSFIAGSSYASFERIRRMHIRHHVERADLTCFDFLGLLRRHPGLTRALQLLEWAYVPATELLMHAQVVVRPFFVRSQRRYLRRSAAMLLVRGALLAALAVWSLKAFALYWLAMLLFLHVLSFFDAFHHTFEQFFVAPDEPLPPIERARGYEQANTYSNLISTRHPWLNLLTLNFGYHNAHHQRASLPWYRLPALHRSLYGEDAPAVMPLRELLLTWHRHRVRRVCAEGYGAPGHGAGRAASFVGAHGVSFLTVV
jgi:fatty acid desaturase